MKKVKYLLVLIIAVSLSSCGIFKKDCGCPHFSKITREKLTDNVA